jgi:hypothetical protein
MPENDVFVRMKLNRLRFTVFAFALLAPVCARAQLKPDALILVQPSRGSAEVVVVFPHTIPHQDAKARIVKLGTISGWTIKAVSVTDQTIETGGAPGVGGRRTVGKQTEITASLSPAPQFAGNAFVLQPYLEAFSDLGRIELLYVFPRDSRFVGIRELDNPDLSLRLINPGGPYRYVVDFKRHGGKIANLPLTQPVAGSNNIAASNRPAATPPAERTDHTARTLLLIFGIATISGILAYAFLRIWGRHRASASRGAAGNLTGSTGRLSRL